MRERAGAGARVAVAGISRRLWRIERDEWGGKEGGSKAIIGGLNLHQSHRKWQSLSPDLLRRPRTTLGTTGTAVASAPAPMPSSSPLPLLSLSRFNPPHLCRFFEQTVLLLS